MKKAVLFTDLDGTLLDHLTYSFEGANEALAMVSENHVPLILCSSKTRSEIEHYRSLLSNTDPFISENGGGIFIPDHYFDMDLDSLEAPVEKRKGYSVIRLGSPYYELRKALEELQSEGFEVRGFGDMTAGEISDNTGLDITEAQMAKERDFDEVFTYEGPTDLLPELFNSIRRKGFTHTQGRFFHILGDTDKGKAVDILLGLFRGKLGDITSIALGDSPNDVPMLRRVDHPIIVRKPDGNFDSRIDVPGLIKADGIGPAGWNKAVIALLKGL